jgi:hypothetical protein
LPFLDDGSWYAQGGNDIKAKDLQREILETLHNMGWMPPIDLYSTEVELQPPAPLKPKPLPIARPRRLRRRKPPG